MAAARGGLANGTMRRCAGVRQGNARRARIRALVLTVSACSGLHLEQEFEIRGGGVIISRFFLRHAGIGTMPSSIPSPCGQDANTTAGETPALRYTLRLILASLLNYLHGCYARRRAYSSQGLLRPRDSGQHC